MTTTTLGTNNDTLGAIAVPDLLPSQTSQACPRRAIEPVGIRLQIISFMTSIALLATVASLDVSTLKAGAASKGLPALTNHVQHRTGAWRMTFAPRTRETQDEVLPAHLRRRSVSPCYRGRTRLSKFHALRGRNRSVIPWVQSCCLNSRANTYISCVPSHPVFVIQFLGTSFSLQSALETRCSS